MQLETLVTRSRRIGATRARSEKIALLAATLRELGAEELDVGLAYLAGEPRQERLQLGPAAVMGRRVPPASAATLTLVEVDRYLQTIADVPAGTGSRRARLTELDDLLGRATADEQAWLRRLVLRELRQGSLEGLLVQAVAVSAELPVDAVRRAAMLAGSLRVAAQAALAGGPEALAAVRLHVGTPLQPMLATTAADLPGALAGIAEAVLEAKLDGARIQVHRHGGEIRVHTRSLQDVTDRVPGIVAHVGALPVTAVVLDGEAIAFDATGRPRPFQETMQRFGQDRDRGTNGTTAPELEARFFDLLHLDGEDVIDAPLRARQARLRTVVPAELIVDHVVIEPGETDRAEAFVRRTLASGHEGVMVKDLDAPYEAGRRGASWRKLKPVHTLDLVVLAAEWGSGRRRGWLSNLHLGARSDDGGFVMLGKTFKGLTDETLRWQTEQLLARETHREGHVVHVRPELVVEVALDGLVRSTRYPGGLALRFARVRGYRPDRDAADADTLAAARAIHDDPALALTRTAR